MATRMNPYPNGPGQTSGRSDGSRTMTIHDVPTGEQGGEGGSGSGGAGGEASSDGGVLRLRGGGGNTRRVVWSSETVDNEGMGKKKSKSESTEIRALKGNIREILTVALHPSFPPQSAASSTRGGNSMNRQMTRLAPNLTPRYRVCRHLIPMTTSTHQDHCATKEHYSQEWSYS